MQLIVYIMIWISPFLPFVNQTHLQKQLTSYKLQIYIQQHDTDNNGIIDDYEDPETGGYWTVSNVKAKNHSNKQAGSG